MPKGLSPELCPDLFIYFTGDTKQHYGEPLYTLISDEGHVRVAKEFSICEEGFNELSIELRTPYLKDNWLPGSRIALSNIQISVKYGK